MKIVELQRALKLVRKHYPNAEVSSYYTDYIGIWIPDEKTRNGVHKNDVSPDLMFAMETEGWDMLYHEWVSDGKYLIDTNKIIGWSK